MTNLIASDVFSLNTGNSPYVELFDLQINDAGDKIYLTNYVEGITQNTDEQPDSGPPTAPTLQFPDYDNNSIINEYFPIPCQLLGVEHRSSGQFPQPTFVVANILKTTSGNDSLTSLLGDISYNDLLGYKVIRRRTLKKYLYGESAYSNPPIELPIDEYYLDRIEDENIASVSFTTVSPMDFTGITLPKRTIIGYSCPWKYKGAAKDKELWERDSGGCTWRTDSIILSGSAVAMEQVFVTEDDERIVGPVGNITWVDADSSPYTAEKWAFVTTTESGLTKINSDGTTTSSTATNYWRKIGDTSADPSDNLPKVWERLRVWEPYSSGVTDTNVYTDDRYNTFVGVGDGGSPERYTIYKAVSKSQTNVSTTPSLESNLWEAGDVCGKRLKSCAKRFQRAIALRFQLTSSTGFAAGDRIFGQTSNTFATVGHIYGGGNRLVLFDVVGSGFQSGETVEVLGSSPTVSTTISTIPTHLISLTNGKAKDILLPFGSFPSARVFDIS